MALGIGVLGGSGFRIQSCSVFVMFYGCRMV